MTKPAVNTPMGPVQLIMLADPNTGLPYSAAPLSGGGSTGSGTPIVLLNNATATPAQGSTWPGGFGCLQICCAAWNNANAALELLGPDGTTFIPLSAETTVSGNAVVTFNAPAGTIRIEISNAVPSAGIYATATPLF